MDESISDTGPVLHLHEIQKIFVLDIFECIHFPGSVVEELDRYGLDATNLDIKAKKSVVNVDIKRCEELMKELSQPAIHLADAGVYILAQDMKFSLPVLTDDLALRKHLEKRGAVAVGSVGLLIRSFHSGLIERQELDNAIDKLFDQSSLHLSPAFRSYVLKLLNEMAGDNS